MNGERILAIMSVIVIVVSLSCDRGEFVVVVVVVLVVVVCETVSNKNCVLQLKAVHVIVRKLRDEECIERERESMCEKVRERERVNVIVWLYTKNEHFEKKVKENIYIL